MYYTMKPDMEDYVGHGILGKQELYAWKQIRACQGWAWIERG